LERIPRQFYTQEFKEESVNLVVDGGLTVAEVGRRLSISPQTLRNWINKYRQEGKVSSGGRSVTDLEAENSRLRKKLAEARLEKEILKKAMAYLAKEPQGGTR
jgi:transposase